MTAPGAGTALLSSSSVIRAVASLGIRNIVTGPERPGRVLGGSGHSAWVATSEGTVVITERGGPRLPNGMEITSTDSTGMVHLAAPGSSVTVGGGAIHAQETISVIRWWDPSPRVGPAAAAEVATRVEGLPDSIDAVSGSEAAMAIVSGEAAAFLEAASCMLGRGSGLTPEADDYLAGALASVGIVGPAVGDREAVPFLDGVSAPLCAIATARTTSLSASLLQQAVRGEVAAPAGAFLRAVCGRGEVGVAYRSVLEIGHSSGPALAAGMVLGLRSVVERASRLRTGVLR